MKSDDLSLLTVQADGRAEMPPDTVVLTWNALVQRSTADQVRTELERQGKELLAALRGSIFPCVACWCCRSWRGTSCFWRSS